MTTQLTSLDVSGLTSLTKLSCGSNQLTSLDVSALTNLTRLDCSSQKILLALTYDEATTEYITEIELNSPTFGHTAITYTNGILRISNINISEEYFSVATGKAGTTLSGWMYFDYISSVLTPDRNIPTAAPVKDAAVVVPSTALTFDLTAGPNPAKKSDGAVNIFASGKAFKDGTLTVYDAAGNVIRKISISDKIAIGNSRRIVGSWDLTDARGRAVADGTYLVRGFVKTADGNREKVSLKLGVRS